MEIKKDSFLFKLAFGLTEESYKPKETTLCRFFWQIVLMSALAWPLYFLVWLPIKWFFIIIGFVLGFLAGYRPAIFKEDKDYDIMVPYKRWPIIFGCRMAAPIHIIVALFCLGCIVFFFHVTTIAYKEGDIVGFAGCSVLVFVYLIAIFLALSPKKNSETAKLFKEYLKAKKEKLCPKVVFTS